MRELLEVDDDRYQALLSARAGCANSGVLAQQVLAYLQGQHPDRFRYADCTNVGRIVVGDDHAIVHAGDRQVDAGHVVLCTNGFVPPSAAPSRMCTSPDAPTTGPTTASPLTCMGGPEYAFYEPVYDREAPFPAELLAAMDDDVRPFAQPARPAGRPYDFHWHGLMGYNDSGIRVVGAHPRHQRLLYNLGCNGVGFLPSLCGADRVGRLLAGERLEPSIFDPR